MGAGGSFTHLHEWSSTPLTAFMSVFVSFGFVLAAMFLSEFLRARCGNSEEINLFDEHTKEAENDFAALALSFLCVQVLRYQLSGNLPDIKGLERPETMHDVQYILGLVGCSVVAAFCSIVVLLLSPSRRIAVIIQAASSMSFAWCIFFAAKEGLSQAVWSLIGDRNMDRNSVCMRVMLACTLSSCAL